MVDIKRTVYTVEGATKWGSRFRMYGLRCTVHNVASQFWVCSGLVKTKNARALPYDSL